MTQKTGFTIATLLYDYKPAVKVCTNWWAVVENCMWSTNLHENQLLPF